MLFRVYVMFFFDMTSPAFIFSAVRGSSTLSGATIALVGLGVARCACVAPVARPLAGIFSERIGRQISLIVGASLNILCFPALFLGKSKSGRLTLR